ncbi:MAG TPA: hypothetical protein VGO80_04925 [Solirubrobacteraceae bacterium]|jgi:uncharacterized membrane protein YeaQ/YmgE (transglycosylase-associated protein family)|nr:hypothetical protein [Solirubrobacteraceae bacterium]
MGLIVYLVLLLAWGLVVGLFARLALPGPDPMSLFQTALVGVAGSLLAAIVALTLFNRVAGFLLCLVFSVAIMYFIRRSRGGGLTDPGAGLRRR